MTVRQPWVAGAFYPAQPESLRRTIESCFKHPLGPGRLPEEPTKKKKIISIVSPHAGYMYSGPVAAHGYYHLSREPAPETVIVLGPNHSGRGSPVSMWGSGEWRTPMGSVEIDADLATQLFKASDLIDLDETAHLREHSIEVQLPFLQYIYGPDFKLIPICMGFQDLETSREVGRALAEVTGGRSTLIVASTDMTHQEPQSLAEKKDQMVIDGILALDEEAVISSVKRERITMCGYGPVSAALVSSKIQGARWAQLLAYHTSGDITKDYGAVVGYASAKITR